MISQKTNSQRNESASTIPSMPALKSTNSA